MMGPFGTLLDAIERRQPVCLVLLLGPRSGTRLVLAAGEVLAGELPGGATGEWILDGARLALAQGRSLTLPAPPQLEPGLEAYFEPYPPRPLLYIIGGGHVGKALYEVAAPLKIFDVTVVDDRPAYANATRFPAARNVCCDFKETFETIEVTPESFVVIVTRGHRADRVCLQRALLTPARYLGMIGSRRKVLLTYKHLMEEGVTREQLQRVHAPIGLALNATGALEIAVSILAELIAVKNGLDPHHVGSLGASARIPDSWDGAWDSGS